MSARADARANAYIAYVARASLEERRLMQRAPLVIIPSSRVADGLPVVQATIKDDNAE
jgi:hypothetical protein